MKGPLAVRLPFKRVEIHLDAEHGMSRLQVYPIWTPPAKLLASTEPDPAGHADVALEPRR
jgi:hypothetical protein